MPHPITAITVIASAAKQSPAGLPSADGDCFVAPLLAMTGWERLHHPRPRCGRGARSSAALFLRGDGAFGVEALDVAAFGAGGRVDDGVDQGGFAGGERVAQRLGQARRILAVV